MDGRRRAVIVGVNRPADRKVQPLRYAEKDALAVAKLLTDPRIGTFHEDDVELFLGPKATASAIKRALRTAAKQAEPSDVLLVYFAGHGVLADRRDTDPYLATCDLVVDELDAEPERGLRMGFLRRDVFTKTAGSSFLILDCCHAGSFATDDVLAADESQRLQYTVDQMYQQLMARHSALLACPGDAATRERSDLQHGVYTHALLEGLRGAAAGAAGHVTFEELGGYVARLNLPTLPGSFVKGWGQTTVLTRPFEDHSQLSSEQAIARTEITVVACANPLDEMVDSATELLDRLFRSDYRPRSEQRSTRRLDLLRYAVEASSAAIVDYHNGSIQLVEATTLFDGAQVADGLAQAAQMSLAHRRAALGHVVLADGAKATLAVPLRYGAEENRLSMLVLVEPARTFLDMGEPLANALQTIWRMDEAADSQESELNLLTSWRAQFGRLPLAIYQRAFQLYQRINESLVMVFEPVMSLGTDPASVAVISWEALARRSADSRRAPAAVLNAAQVWGDQFTIERDGVLARKAILSYADAHAASVYRHGPRAPISINVAVRSLLSDAYTRVLRESLDEAGFNPRTVTLEISEQDPISPNPGETWLPNPNEFFRQRLASLVQTLAIHFALDDFGVGHASLDRLASLSLTQIKVDRAVLHHALALEELALVIKVARLALERGDVSTPRTVVVEGYDEEAPVALEDIYKVGVDYVQGYITGDPASPQLRTLSNELKTTIAMRLRSIGGRHMGMMGR